MPEHIPITIDLTGPDWEPISPKYRFYAQRGKGPYAFGASEVRALANLLASEASK